MSVAPVFEGTILPSTVAANLLMVGDKLYDPAKTGTHNQRVLVEWVREHPRRQRIYVAGVEENSSSPVTLAYDSTESVTIYR